MYVHKKTSKPVLYWHFLRGTYDRAGVEGHTFRAGFFNTSNQGFLHERLSSCQETRETSGAFPCHFEGLTRKSYVLFSSALWDFMYRHNLAQYNTTVNQSLVLLKGMVQRIFCITSQRICFNRMHKAIFGDGTKQVNSPFANTTVEDFEAYNLALVSICRKHDLPVFDLYRTSLKFPCGEDGIHQTLNRGSILAQLNLVLKKCADGLS